MIKDWITTFAPKTQYDYQQALREIMQQITLAALYRGGFFKEVAFYGGTALRIFYGLDRFSEDLDFSLMRRNPDFTFDQYFQNIDEEFKAQGMEVSLKTRHKSKESAIESAFLKSQTLWGELSLEAVAPQIGLQQNLGIKIKLEADTEPPLGFQTEEKLLLRPFSFYVKCFTLEDLFAGKMHALLFRKWKNNVKGRDWYDLEWYIRKGVELNLEHFFLRAKDSGDWETETMSGQEFRQLLKQRIKNVNLEQAKSDIARFIPDPKVLEIWSKKYFLDLVGQLKIGE